MYACVRVCLYDGCVVFEYVYGHVCVVIVGFCMNVCMLANVCACLVVVLCLVGVWQCSYGDCGCLCVYACL